jgi:Glucodextranase, domain N
MSPLARGLRGALAAMALAPLILLAEPARAKSDGPAPGAPGISRTGPRVTTASDPPQALASRAWFTLDDGLTEVSFPDLGTPRVRNVQFVLSDGTTFAEREREDAIHKTRLVDSHSLIYRQVNTARSGRWRITKDLRDRCGAGDSCSSPGRSVSAAERRHAAPPARRASPVRPPGAACPRVPALPPSRGFRPRP